MQERVAREELTEPEKKTTRILHKLSGEILTALAEHFGGATTINHLVIGNYIGMKSLHEKGATSNREISEALGISRPTVSRIVTDFISQGWVLEEQHPGDGRKRLLVINPDHPRADHFEKEFRRKVNKLLDLYDAQKIVKVDPAKKSF